MNLPITEFAKRFPKERVRWMKSATVELSQATLPTDQQVIVLQASTA